MSVITDYANSQLIEVTPGLNSENAAPVLTAVTIFPSTILTVTQVQQVCFG